MAYATTYDRVTGAAGFTQHSTSFPTTPHSGTNFDAEFNALRTHTAEMLNNLKLIQRNDGLLGNATVGQDKLKTEIYAGINEPAAWVTSTAYSLRDAVINGTGLCISASSPIRPAPSRPTSPR